MITMYFHMCRFIIVAVISGVGLLYRIATFTPAFRQILLRTRSRLASSDNVEAISRKCQIGDWFVLYQLGKLWLFFFFCLVRVKLLGSIT